MAQLENHHSSSMIKYSEYREEDNILMIEFNNGDEYVYWDVPSEVYEGLVDASSTGRYFNETIKDTYDFQKK